MAEDNRTPAEKFAQEPGADWSGRRGSKQPKPKTPTPQGKDNKGKKK